MKKVKGNVMVMSNTLYNTARANNKKLCQVCTPYRKNCFMVILRVLLLKGIYPEFQVIRGFSQKIPAGLLSYDQIHS